jgi:uncharacterized protein (DUF1778 family)
VRINLRVRPDIREDFQTAAFISNKSMSEILCNFIRKTIAEAEKAAPEVFAVRRSGRTVAAPVTKANQNDASRKGHKRAAS